MTQPLAFLQQELSDLEKKGLRRSLETLESAQGPRVKLSDGVERLNFCSNDYLSLAKDPRLTQASSEALERWGTGSGASRLLAGDLALHHQLESAIAKLKGTEAALLFNSGWHANVGTIPALVGKDDLIISDALNHASLIDGARLSRAQIEVVPHRDLEGFEKALHIPARRKLLVTDSVFSMEGTLAPLRELRALCDTHKAMLYVDEAHATGLYGNNGGGLAQELGVVPDVQMGTLGKALGSFGAYIAGSSTLREWLINRARAFVFTTALPPAICAASLKAVQIVREEPETRQKLHTLSARLRQGFRSLGHPVSSEPSAIVPLQIGGAEQAMEIATKLSDAGILARAVRPPTVPEGTSRIRFVVQAGHQVEEIDRVIEVVSSLALTP